MQGMVYRFRKIKILRFSGLIVIPIFQSQGISGGHVYIPNNMPNYRYKKNTKKSQNPHASSYSIEGIEKKHPTLLSFLSIEKLWTIFLYSWATTSGYLMKRHFLPFSFSLPLRDVFARVSGTAEWSLITRSEMKTGYNLLSLSLCPNFIYHFFSCNLFLKKTADIKWWQNCLCFFQYIMKILNTD